MSSESAWSKLPIDLQEQFYDKAEKEAQNLIKILEETKTAIALAEPKILPHIHQIHFGSDEEIAIAAVDGSFSPRPSERIGARFAVYSAGFVMLIGNEITKEGYLSGDLRYSQAYTRSLFSAALHVQESHLERKAALLALKEGPDLLLIDGGFLSFAYSLFRIRREIPVPDWMDKIAMETLEMTIDLMNSKKCAGIVKRGRTRALGGWLSAREGKVNSLVRYLDKQILQSIMPAPSTLSYQEMLGEPGAHRVYSRVSELLNSGKLSEPKEAILEARDWAVNSLSIALGINREAARDLGSKIARIQVKVFDEMPPFELEIPVDAVGSILGNLFSGVRNFNMATGLPMVIDLIDESVSLPSEFTKEFVTEVEARVANSYPGDLNEVKQFFTNLNPQKEI